MTTRKLFSERTLFFVIQLFFLYDIMVPLSGIEAMTSSRTECAVVIDGSLDEPCWQRVADVSELLITYSPSFGEHQPFKTELWLAHDSERLYFAVRACDPEPGLIKSSITKRDNIDADDWVAVSLEPTGGRQNALVLMVNPDGIQGDKHESAFGTDVSADYVWNSAASRTDEGFDVEICVPLKSIRFRSGRDVAVNLLLMRHVARLGSKACWPSKSPSQSFLAVHQPVIYDELNRTARIELMPAVTYGSIWDRLSAESWSAADDDRNIGITAKFGISSSVTAEATVNPDFSQVESDEFQVLVNQRYPIFYAEKRPFFMEAGSLFNLAASDDSGDYNMYSAVHTRFIVEPDWGVRLSGEHGPAVFGLMAVRDGWSAEGAKDPATILLGRLKWNLGSDNFAGILYSGRYTEEDKNNALALDLSYKLNNHHFSTKAILSGSKSGNETLSDTALTASWGCYTKKLSTFLVFEHVGDDFRMDSSYLLRNGMRRVMGYVAPSFYPKRTTWLKRLNFMLWGYQVHDYRTLADDYLYFIAMRAYFPKQANLRMDWRRFSEQWAGRQLKGDYFYLGGQVQLTNSLFFYLSFDAGDRILYDSESPLVGKGFSGQGMVMIQPSGRLALELSVLYEKMDHPISRERLYDVNILRFKSTYQLNRYLFFRGIVQYDSSQKKVISDLLASFTLIPETVLHIGYGSVHEKVDWNEASGVGTGGMGTWYNTKQSFFFKAGYRFRF